MSALLHVGVSKVALARRRIPTRLELGTHVHLHTDTSPAPSAEKDQSGPSPSNPSGCGLGTERVICRTPGHDHLSSDQAAIPVGSPHNSGGFCTQFCTLHLRAWRLSSDSRELSISLKKSTMSS